MVLERLLDTGVSVRKSVVKILRDALLLHQRHTALTGVAAGFEASSREGFLGEGCVGRSIELFEYYYRNLLSRCFNRRDVLICRKLVELCGKVYEEDSVKNLIYSTFEDLWFRYVFMVCVHASICPPSRMHTYIHAFMFFF